ncbi:MAG: 4-phosphoerythronate dehydrogenase [Lysobacterales bacterium]
MRTEAMNIVADENIPLLDETFGRHGEVRRLRGRAISRSDLEDTDVLLVRSVTRVGPSLLEGTAVRFVGSATIGVDHLDTDWLEMQGIAWAHAPGCNADAASQYALAMMWLACNRLGKRFRDQQVGIIGRGNVGGRLQRLLAALGVAVAACDPPLRDAGRRGLVDMERACDGDIISLHVPLTDSGPYPTRRLFGPARLERLRRGALLVNTSRGGVVDAPALLGCLRGGRLHAALDVWPDEPLIATELLEAVCVGTPHVAGYSIEGKQSGTRMIYDSFCGAFSLVAAPPPAQALDGAAGPAHESLEQAVMASCPVARDDAALRAELARDTGGPVNIDPLRAAYPPRREFSACRVAADADGQAAALGFQVG